MATLIKGDLTIVVPDSVASSYTAQGWRHADSPAPVKRSRKSSRKPAARKPAPVKGDPKPGDD